MRRIDRFDKFMAFKGLNDNKVTIECGLSVGLLGKARSGKSDLGEKAIEKILNIYQDLSHVWLLTGEGSMLKTTDQPISQESDGTTPSEVDPNNLGTMKNFFDALERRDREIEAQGRRMDRLITIIERMSGVAGAEIEALKKEG